MSTFFAFILCFNIGLLQIQSMRTDRQTPEALESSLTRTKDRKAVVTDQHNKCSDLTEVCMNI